MKKFMVFYMADPATFETMMKNSTPDMQKKGMEAWMHWMTAHKGSIVDGGAPWGRPSGSTRTARRTRKTGLAAIRCVQANSHEAAAKLFGKDHPHLQMMPGAWVEVVEIMPMPGM